MKNKKSNRKPQAGDTTSQAGLLSVLLGTFYQDLPKGLKVNFYEQCYLTCPIDMQMDTQNIRKTDRYDSVNKGTKAELELED